MSTKVSILSGEGYHFYFDYKDWKNHIDYDSPEGAQNFLDRVADILGGCPFSDSGIHMVNLKDPGKSGKWDDGNEINCSALERKRLERGLSSRMYLCGGCDHMVQEGKTCAVCEFEGRMSNVRKTNKLQDKLDSIDNVEEMKDEKN